VAVVAVVRTAGHRIAVLQESFPGPYLLGACFLPGPGRPEGASEASIAADAGVEHVAEHVAEDRAAAEEHDSAGEDRGAAGEARGEHAGAPAGKHAEEEPAVPVVLQRKDTGSGPCVPEAGLAGTVSATAAGPVRAVAGWSGNVAVACVAVAAGDAGVGDWHDARAAWGAVWSGPGEGLGLVHTAR
jgi:hypothetical protein